MLPRASGVFFGAVIPVVAAQVRAGTTLEIFRVPPRASLLNPLLALIPSCRACMQIKRKKDAARAKLSQEELAALEKKERGVGGWWGSFWGSATSKKEEGDLALQDLTASFGEDAGANKVRVKPACG